MRRFMKSISIILTVCMFFQCAGAAAFADKAEEKSEDDRLYVEVISEEKEQVERSDSQDKPAPAAEPVTEGCRAVRKLDVHHDGACHGGGGPCGDLVAAILENEPAAAYGI